MKFRTQLKNTICKDNDASPLRPDVISGMNKTYVCVRVTKQRSWNSSIHQGFYEIIIWKQRYRITEKLTKTLIDPCFVWTLYRKLCTNRWYRCLQKKKLVRVKYWPNSKYNDDGKCSPFETIRHESIVWGRFIKYCFLILFFFLFNLNILII